MAFINVAEWTPQNVVSWLQGLEDSILPYVAFFLNNNINGCRLLLLSCDDLENLNVTKVGHQEIILEAVELLKHLHYNFCSETLQMLTLRLGCKARSLFNILKRETDDEEKSRDRVSTTTLSGVCDILTSVKLFVSWIDRYPFGGQEDYISIRKEILKLSIELASTAQRDQFVEKPNEVIKENCAIFAETCDKIVQDLNDPLAIQPAYLEVITIKKKTGEDIFSGLHFSSSYSGIHIVERIDRSSIFYRGRIEEGDEIVQINYQTVVGWHTKKILNTVKEFSTEVAITLKKRPRHSNQITVLKQFKIVNRKLKSTGSRYRNASTTTGHSDNDSDNGSIKERTITVADASVNSMMPRRPRIVRRRSSISGSSPTTTHPPTRIDDVYNKRDMILSRTVSHDEGKNSLINSSLITGKSKISPGTSCESCCSKNSNNSIPVRKSLSSSQVPYAKVHPLLNRESVLSIPKPPSSPHYVTPPPLPPQPKHLLQQHQHSQQSQHQHQQHHQQQQQQNQQSSQSRQVQQSQNVQRTQNQQSKTKPTIKLTTYDIENDPEFHEYQPPPSPKLPPSPPKTPTSTKSVPPPAPAPRQRVIDELLRNVTLPRRKSDEGSTFDCVNRLTSTLSGPKPFTNKNNSSNNITSRPQPPLPRVIGVARSSQPFNSRDNKCQQLSSYSDSSADSLKSIESDCGDVSNDKHKSKPAIPPKSHKIHSRLIL